MTTLLPIKEYKTDIVLPKREKENEFRTHLLQSKLASSPENLQHATI